MPNSSKNGLLNYWVSAQWNIMHPLIIILMTMEHRGDAYSRKKQNVKLCTSYDCK